ncbi:hypothetical protein H0H93_013799, partial [Arthromyces matolae]
MMASFVVLSLHPQSNNDSFVFSTSTIYLVFINTKRFHFELSFQPFIASQPTVIVLIIVIMLKKPSRFIIVDDNTIKDSSDETEFVRSRKRPRREDSDELSPPASQTHPDAFKCRKPASDIDHKTRPSLKSDHDGTQILIHDPQYYFRDDKEADCFIRVEKILFKVHRDKLFMSKLMEKRITGRPEPTTGQDPLELFGVSVIEFRALMWASEDEAEGQPRALEDLERLLSLSTVTKNCGFDRLHEWSITSIHRAFTSNSSLVDSCSSAILTRVIEVAAQYKAADLLDAVVNKWCERIQRKDSPSVPAILAADEHKLEKLGGVAYYAHLLEAIAQAPPPKTNDTPLRIQADPKLNSKQLLRLLS